MDIKHYFDHFWNDKGRYLQINNVERTYINLSKKLSTLSDFKQIDDYVCSLKTRKESTRIVMVNFFDFLNEKENMYVDSVLYHKQFFDYPFERQLEIAKYLCVPRSVTEIQDRFDISARTLSNDLKTLEEGLGILGSKIIINKETKGRKYYYQSTLNPIFLPLNLTEVFIMTKYLSYLSKRDGHFDQFEEIVNRIKAQLSDYAFNKLFLGEEKPQTSRYIDEREFIKNKKSLFLYFQKTGTIFSFIYKGQDYKGKLEPNFDCLRISTDNGDLIKADFDEIEVIDFEYI